MSELPKPTARPAIPETHRSPDIAPSPEEFRDLQTRFDSVANSPFHKKDGNPKFLTQTDPDTGTVITRTIQTFGHQTGSTEYQLGDNGIALIVRPDIIGADPPLCR